ncbi:hypothetical protein BDF19DRAFT_494012 [Syncephalis fuscata]|nr:hypothetical protein BDF19DRAFT_494012 [Syncephalis fuscata]
MMNAYEDLKATYVGDPVVKWSKAKARRTKKNKDEASTDSAIIESSEKQEFDARDAILVWPIDNNSPPNIIYFDGGPGEEWVGFMPKLVDAYNDWMLFRISNINLLRFEFHLYSCNESQWIEVSLGAFASSSIQVACRDQCQVLNWKITRKFLKTSDTSTSTAAQNVEIISNDYPAIRVAWKLSDFQTGQSQCKKILSGQIDFPYYPNAIIKSEVYTSRMCLVILHDATKGEEEICNGTFKALLSLFALGKLSSNNSPEFLFDAKDYEQLLPIDSSEQARILWTRTIGNNTVTKLYSEKLIIVQNVKKYDILDARNGDLLRSIVCSHHSNLVPLLGSLCAMFDGEFKKNYLVDMHTGLICKPSARLISRQMEDGPQPFSNRDRYLKRFKYYASNAIVGRINMNNGAYEAFIL